MAGGKKTTVEIAAELAAPLIEEQGLILWDVEFVKEGSTWILRYLIDKEGGLTIDDCEAFSRAVNDKLDAADPIDSSYTLEVSSPGIERELTRDWHFEACMGETVRVRLIRPVEGQRDFIGELTGYEDNKVTILLEDDVEMTIDRSEAAYIRLYYEF